MDLIDTDINSYSLKELKDLLKITDKYTEQELNIAYKNKILLNNKLEDNDIKNRVNLFFKEIYDYLLIHSSDYNNKQTNKIINEMERIENKLN